MSCARIQNCISPRSAKFIARYHGRTTIASGEQVGPTSRVAPISDQFRFRPPTVVRRAIPLRSLGNTTNYRPRIVTRRANTRVRRMNIVVDDPIVEQQRYDTTTISSVECFLALRRRVIIIYIDIGRSRITVLGVRFVDHKNTSSRTDGSA